MLTQIKEVILTVYVFAGQLNTFNLQMGKCETVADFPFTLSCHKAKTPGNFTLSHIIEHY